MSLPVPAVEVDKNLDLETLTPDNSVTDGRADLGFEPKVGPDKYSMLTEIGCPGKTASGIGNRPKIGVSNLQTGSGRGHSDFRLAPKDAARRDARTLKISGRYRRN